MCFNGFTPVEPRTPGSLPSRSHLEDYSDSSGLGRGSGIPAESDIQSGLRVIGPGGDHSTGWFRHGGQGPRKQEVKEPRGQDAGRIVWWLVVSVVGLT